MLVLRQAPHPLLDAHAFTTQLPSTLGALENVEALRSLLRIEAKAPLQSSDEIRGHVRDLLRHGGYKPTGRGKPASEYLWKAASSDPPALGSINALVDACNVVSLHSGLPISVIDVDRATGSTFRLGVAEHGTSYVFNASGQSIDVGGLLCLFDDEGPCANAVKDSQRTKTHAETRRTLSIVWGCAALPGLAAAATQWYQDLLRSLGASCETVTIQ